jgi:hypothetical protein
MALVLPDPVDPDRSEWTLTGQVETWRALPP